MDKCNGCGKMVDYYGNHHCDPKLIRVRDMIMQRGREPAPRKRPFYIMLQDGMKLIQNT